MTLAHNLADLNKKEKEKRRESKEKSKQEKKKRNLKKKKSRGFVLIFILLTIILALGLTVWIFIQNEMITLSPLEFKFWDCSEFKESFSVENACNLNENEVEVSLKRSFDDINLERIKLEFQDSGSLWKIDGAKCLDVRLKENKYGSYCELIKEEESNSYVFNLSLGKQTNVKVQVEGNGITCNVGQREIAVSC